MNNKMLGWALIIFAVLMLSVLFFIKLGIDRAYQAQIDFYETTGGTCPTDPNICPHTQKAKAQIPIYIGAAIMLAVASLGFYLIFFEKSQQEVIRALKETKDEKFKGEKFDILLSGLGDDEKKIIKAVKEQDGITQATLRIRTDMSKAKLSVVLSGLEKKGLIKKVAKGKTNQVFLKKAI
ncbi:MAG: hypothetical protein Q7J54_04145 [Candidatus Woesearchaeota archaeon]|nr:hypothetical protein [Candidatus Woesearchaeota archaeon]